MNLFEPSLYFSYLVKLYTKNLLAILLGLSLAFTGLDYFQHIQQLDLSSNYKILYMFYVWQVSLGVLYPLAIMFAVLMTKLTLVKNNTMGALHAFGYTKKRLFTPFLVVASLTYFIFTLLHTTEFSYAREKADLLLKKELQAYDVNDLFFKYNDTFVYIKKLDPVAKQIEDITIFKVEGYRVQYTIHAPIARFNGEEWNAYSAILKTHVYKNGSLDKYTVEYKESIKTLKGYKPKIIESLYEGKALNIIDAFNTWLLLQKQNVDSAKIRAVFYAKVTTPLFAIAMLLLLFFKLPHHMRMANMSTSVALASGSIIVVWGVLFGLERIGYNGVVEPEFTSLLPVLLLLLYAGHTYKSCERTL